jgi:hypothetical protein
MIDEQTSELEFASEVGFRVVKTGPDAYQFQRIDGRGRSTSVTPTQQHAYDLWRLLVCTARKLGAAVEGGKAGDGAEPGKSESPQVA